MSPSVAAWMAIAGWIFAALLGSIAVASFNARRRAERRLRHLAADHALLAGANDRLVAETRATDESRRAVVNLTEDGTRTALDDVGEPTVTIRSRPILNLGEANVLAACEAYCARRAERGWRAYPQVSLGEVFLVGGLEPALTARAFRAINAKRSDVIIVDAAGVAVALVEVQGAGHFQGDAAERDAVKRAACERAGIAFIEIADGMRRDAIMALLDRALVKS